MAYPDTVELCGTRPDFIRVTTVLHGPHAAQLHAGITPNYLADTWSVFTDDGHGNGDFLRTLPTLHAAMVWATNWLTVQLAKRP